MAAGVDMQMETIRQLTLRATNEGFPETTAAVKGLGAAYDGNSKAAQTNATVSDISSKRALSAAEAYNRQTMSVDANARSLMLLERSQRVANAAYEQGILGAVGSAEAQAALAARTAMLQEKYLGTANAARTLGASVSEAGAALASYGIGGGVALTMAASWGKSILDNVAALHDQAEQVGVSVTTLQAYRHVLEDSGSSADMANTLINKVSRTLGEAETGSKKAREEFDALGINWHDLATSANPVEAAMQAVAAGIDAIPDPAKRAQEQMIFMGKSGSQMGAALHLLALDIDNLKKMYDGRSFSDADAAKADAATKHITAAWQRLETDAAPAVVAATNAVANLIEHLESLTVKDWVVNIVMPGKGIGDAVGAMINGVPKPDPTALGGANDPYIYHPMADGLPDPKPAAVAGQQLSESLVVGSKAANDMAKGLKEARGHADALRETFSGYLAQLHQSTDAAGLLTGQAQDQAAVIKGAQILEKQRKDTAHGLIEDYAAAVTYLNAQTAALIEQEGVARRLKDLMKQGAVDQFLQQGTAGVDKDHRDLVLKDLQDELAVGGKINAQGQIYIDLSNDQIKAIHDKNTAIQAGQDQQALGDYLAGLKEQVSLTRLSTEEQERQRAILEATHLAHGALSDDMKKQIVDTLTLTQAQSDLYELMAHAAVPTLLEQMTDAAAPLEEFPAGFVDRAEVRKEIELEMKEIFG